jgi:hypothetical protein
VDWVKLLGPGGIIGLLALIERVLVKRRRLIEADQETIVNSWRGIADEQRRMVESMQAELDDLYNDREYWRARATYAEEALRHNGIRFSVPTHVRRRRPPSSPPLYSEDQPRGHDPSRDDDHPA